MRIVDLIPYGKDKAITKDELIDKYRLSEELLEASIKAAGKRGVTVVVLAKHVGYFKPLPCDVPDILQQGQLQINLGG